MKDATEYVSGARARISSIGDEGELNLLELGGTLWRGKYWIGLAIAIAIVVGGYYAYVVATPRFTAQAVVALNNREAQIVDFESVMSGLSGDQATINTEIEVLRSRGLAERVVKKLDLLNDPEFNASLRPPAVTLGSLLRKVGLRPELPAPSEDRILTETVSRLLSAITVSNIRSSYVFNITVVTERPRKSAEIANAIADTYIRDQLEVKFAATEQASGWLSERVSGLKGELEAAESKAKSFAAETKLVSPEALDALNRQIKDTRERLSDLEASISAREERVAALANARMSGDRVKMQAAADDIALNRLVDEGASDELFDERFELVEGRATLDLDRTRAQVATLQESVVRLEADYAQQADDLVTLQQLQRDAEATRLLYEYFLSRLKETAAQEGIQQADARILSNAIVPSVASEPRKTQILALSAILGMILGGGAVLIREMMHSGFRSASELESHTGHSVMGQIPTIPARARKDVVGYLIEKPTSAAAEAVRNLRTSVVLSNVDTPPKVLLVSSSVPGEGKTTTSIALAQNFSGMGKKVLLVEGDIRRRVFSEYFELPGKNGLLAILSGRCTFEDAVQRLERVGCDVLIGEKSSTNAADVFSSHRFHDFVAELRGRYDIVIIDTPPVLVVPDARIIAQVVDTILFAVKWDGTARVQLDEAIRQFETAGRRVTGLVLTQIDPKGMKRYGYGNRYGAYAAYGSGYYDK